MKTCDKCGEAKLNTPDNFHRVYAGRDDYLVKTCIPCKAIYGKIWYDKNRYKQLLKGYLNFDKARNFPFDLDVEWCITYIEKAPCHYCGVNEPRMGLDRLDNSLGHTKKNCVPCCTTCNRVRLDVFSVEEMQKLGAVIREIKLSRPLSEPAEIGLFGHRAKVRAQ